MEAPEIPEPLLSGAHPAAAWQDAGVTLGHLRAGLGSIPYRGRYSWAATDATHPRQRALAAASLLDPRRREALGGWAAAHLLGVQWLDGTDAAGRPLPPPIVIDPTRRVRRPGVEVRRGRLDEADVVVLPDHHDVRVTSPVRTAFDLARHAASLPQAVERLDAMARHGVAPADVLAYAGSHPWRDGVRRVRQACSLASDRVRSPAESRWRMLWVLVAGLAPPLVNATVVDAHGRSLGEVDLLDAELGLVGEYDGSPHSDAAARTRDTVKREALERVGLVVVRATAVDVGRHRTRTVHRLRTAAATPRAPGEWHLVQRPIAPLRLTPHVQWSLRE